MGKIGPMSRIQNKPKVQPEIPSQKIEDNKEPEKQTETVNKTKHNTFGAYSALISSHERVRKNAIRKENQKAKVKAAIEENESKQKENIDKLTEEIEQSETTTKEQIEENND